MALTIEDGTGVTGADSFATLVEYGATQTELFAAEIDGTDAVKEAALRRAWLFMKSLAWGKSDSENVYPTFGGTIPADIKTAQAILARVEQESPNALQPSVVPGQQKILTRVGEIGWTPTGQTGVDAQRTTVTMAIDLLEGYLSGTGQTKFLKRG